MTPEPTEPTEQVSDAQWRALVERGPILPLPVWRRIYHRLGIDWPGEAEVRRRHRVTDTDTDTPPTVWQMSWRTPNPRAIPGTPPPSSILLALVTEISDDIRQVKHGVEALLDHYYTRPERVRHETVNATFELDGWEHREAQRLAAASGMTIDEYISRALRDAASGPGTTGTTHRRPQRGG